jgi:asparagine synthase (glutamine-hydrolysing)
VALNGDGGDENFAGYQRYLAELYAERVEILPGVLRHAIATTARKVGGGGRTRTLRSRAMRALGTIDMPSWSRYDQWMSVFRRGDINSLYERDFAQELPSKPSAASLIADPWLGSTARNTVEVMLDVDVQTYLPGDLLVKMDIASMAHSLEVRSPFLDHVLMERVARFPADLKLRRRVPKALLKEAMRPWLPDSVIDRPKMGFGVPIASWFRDALSGLPAEILLDQTAVARGIFRPDGVRALIDDHRAGVSDNSGKLWALLQLELWFRTYIDAERPERVSLASPAAA